MFKKIKTLVLFWIVKRRLQKVNLPSEFVEAIKEDAKQMELGMRHCHCCGDLYRPTAPNQRFCEVSCRKRYHKIISQRHG